MNTRNSALARVASSPKPTVAVRVVDGDILTMAADAIVNPWNRNFVPRKLLQPGGLSEKLKARTTAEPWRQLSKLGLLPTGEVVVTEAGGLPGYRLMFHAVGLTFGWKATADSVTECARNIVRRAIERQVRSITVPLIGAGTGKLAPAASEAAILSALADVGLVVDDGESAEIAVTIVRYPADRVDGIKLQKGARASARPDIHGELGVQSARTR